ncbi:hypothetical protein FN846DRAFT_940402 [Sphaerosporella brunnea]|uniref:Uncharacterized protein n=1 Tax=Sphaerosporella brunnea TaxID=1250544 RepID=A0A5J5F2C1_9PEZI|nr:hypothetical protein FN846DRAFT_940402 [Sphaerosporella brunnea]
MFFFFFFCFFWRGGWWEKLLAYLSSYGSGVLGTLTGAFEQRGSCGKRDNLLRRGRVELALSWSGLERVGDGSRLRLGWLEGEAKRWVQRCCIAYLVHNSTQVSLIIIISSIHPSPSRHTPARSPPQPTAQPPSSPLAGSSAEQSLPARTRVVYRTRLDGRERVRDRERVRERTRQMS